MTEDSPAPVTVEPIAEPVLVRETEPPKPEVGQKRSGGGMALLGGIVAAVIGFGVAQLVPNGWPLGNLAAVEAQVAAQTAEIAALQTALAQSAPDAGLADRMAALESAPAPDVTTLETRIAALEAQIAALPAASSAVDSAALAALQAEVSALKASGGPLPAAVAEMTKALDVKLAAATADTAAIVAQVEQAAAAADQRSAVGQIRAALDSGAAYASALLPLAAMTLPEVLMTGAESGLPTLQSLQASFPDAARTALDAAMRANMGDTWTQRVGSFLLTQTGARSLSPREGTDPDAVLSRAEAALAQGDLATTISELNGLPDAGLAAMQDWLALANTRLAAQDAVTALSTTLEQ